MYIPLIIAIIVLILVIVVLILTLRQPRKESPLTFIHIPKNGGSSIVRIGASNGLNWRYDSIRPPYAELDRPSFCVVRNPYDRMLAQYIQSGSKKDLNTYIIHKLNKYIEDNYINNCSFIPQYEYAKYATHILHYENLNEEFALLMQRYNLDLMLDHDEVSHGRYTVDDISHECIGLINKIYEVDFDNLLYTMR